jgi:hypothetical protein
MAVNTLLTNVYVILLVPIYGSNLIIFFKEKDTNYINFVIFVGYD